MNREYIVKLIWAVCWNEDQLHFDVEECLDLLVNLNLINPEKILDNPALPRNEDEKTSFVETRFGLTAYKELRTFSEQRCEALHGKN